jgi:multisubunit Na+/H+ antiporter MnhE subunit
MGYVPQFVASYAVWVLLTWPFAGGSLAPGWQQELLAGLPAAALCAAAFGKIFPRTAVSLREPLRWLLSVVVRLVFAVAWLAALCWNAVLGGLDSAWRALRPQPAAGRPAIVRVRTTVRSDAGRFALALSLSLSPGMVAVDMVGQDIYVHWADALTDSPGLRAELTVGRFEELVRRTFD